MMRFQGPLLRAILSGWPTPRIGRRILAQILSEMPMFGEQKSTWEEAGNADAPGVQGIVQG
ncbi:MAG: hypothetical protein ACLUKN_03970 [Bacilli bacterium]